MYVGSELFFPIITDSGIILLDTAPSVEIKSLNKSGNTNTIPKVVWRPFRRSLGCVTECLADQKLEDAHIPLPLLWTIEAVFAWSAFFIAAPDYGVTTLILEPH